MIDEVDLLDILLWDFVWPVENIPSYRGGRSQVKPAIKDGIVNEDTRTENTI